MEIEATGFGSIDDEQGKTSAVIVRQHGIGSGVIVDSDGYIMTNAHVIEGAQRIRVKLSLPGKFQRLDATVIGLERLSDLALLKIDAQRPPGAVVQPSRPPQPGELVVRDRQPERSAELGHDGRDQFGVAAAGSR